MYEFDIRATIHCQLKYDKIIQTQHMDQRS